MTERANPSTKRESDLTLPEGLEAGLVGALAVVAVYIVHDLTTPDWLYTPTVLGTLLYSGPDAASMVAADTTAAEPGVAALYHAVHFALWIGAGFATSALVKLAERRPGFRFLALLAFATLIAFFFALDSLVDATGIGTLHLWAGGLSGALAIAAYLLWRHPGVIASAPDPGKPR
ncbi:MAG TPA: hypothetical protein VMS55_15805 [Myxococcota bacterium]|nr:hypothetical protein [Myxococcota bacterium]